MIQLNMCFTQGIMPSKQFGTYMLCNMKQTFMSAEHTLKHMAFQKLQVIKKHYM